MDACRRFILLLPSLLVGGLIGAGVPLHAWADAGDDQYAVAASHYSAGRWQFASEEFAKLVDDHAGHRRVADALFFSGEALMQQQSYGEAASRFDQLLKQKPEYRHARQAMFRRGEAAYLSGDSAIAAKHLQAFLGRFEQDTLAAYVLPYLAATKLKLNDRAGAEALYAQATAQFPEGPLAAESWLRLGVLRYERNEFDSALAALTSFETNHTGSPLLTQAKYWKGMAHTARQDWDVAVGHFDAVLSADPSGPWADNSLLGKIQIDATQGDVDAIRAHAATFRQQFPQSELTEDVDAIELRSLLAGKQYAQIIALLQPRVEAAGNNTDTATQRLRHQLAMAYTAHGQQDAALKQFAKLKGNGEAQQEGDALAAQAAIHVDRKDYALAITSLKEYLATHPDGKHAARCLGQLSICLLKTDKREEAVLQYERLQAKHADDPLFLATTLELAETSLRAGDGDWASTLFDRLTLKNNPPNYVARGIAGKAWCACLGKDLERSALSFQRLLDEFPDDPLAVDAALAQAKILQKLGRAETALRAYRLVTERYSQHESVPLALLRMGQLLKQLERTDQAAIVYRQLIEKHVTAKEVAEARYGLGWLYLDRNETKPAVKQFQTLQTHHRTSKFWADATYRLAQRAFENQDYDRASLLASEISAANSSADETSAHQQQVDAKILGHALYIQGQVAIAQGKWSEVDVPLTRLLEETPDSAMRLPAEYWLAEAAYRRESHDLAERRFEALSKKIGGRDDAWLGMVPLRRAQLLAQKKEWSEAAEIAGTIREEHPGFAQIYEADYLLGRCLAGQAKFDEARAAYRLVTSAEAGRGGRSETAAMAQWMIGETYLHQKNYQSAIRAYLRVPPLYAYPRWQAGALLQAGQCHEYRAEWKQALRLYERVQSEFPNTLFADKVAERLRIAKRYAVETKTR